MNEPAQRKWRYALALSVWVPGATAEEAEANGNAIRAAVDAKVHELEAAEMSCPRCKRGRLRHNVEPPRVPEAADMFCPECHFPRDP